MSVHFAEVLQIFLCVVVGMPIMRSPLQILFLVLVTDLPPAIALGVEPAEDGIMDAKPRPKTQPVVLPWMWRCIVANGMILTASIMAIYVVALHAYAGAFFQKDIVKESRSSCRVWRTTNFFSYIKLKDNHEEGDPNVEPDGELKGEDLADVKFERCYGKFAIRRARTCAFISLVWAENLRAYTARSFTKPIFVKTFNNPAMNKAVFTAQICLYCALFIPGLNEAVLGLYPYEINWWGWVLAFIGAFLAMAGCELYKFVSSFFPPAEYVEPEMKKKKFAPTEVIEEK